MPDVIDPESTPALLLATGQLLLGEAIVKGATTYTLVRKDGSSVLVRGESVLAVFTREPPAGE